MKLGDIFKTVSDKWTPGQKFDAYIGLEDVESSTGLLKSTQNESPKSTKTRFEFGDIIFGRLRPNLNKAWLANIENAICSTDFVVLRAKGVIKVTSSFYLLLLQSSKLNRQIVQGISGANLPRVSATYLLNLDVPCPPIEIQKLIVAEFSQEQEIAESSKKLVGIFEQKIQATLSDIRGE